MKKITINCILHERARYIESFVKEILKISNESKNLIKVNLIVAINDNFFELLNNDLNVGGIESKYITLNNPSHNHDYPNKMRIAIENSDTEFFIKMDEDVFIPHPVWEFLIQNTEILNDDENLFVSPIISNGIPSVDLFINEFLDEKTKIKLFTNFKNFEFNNLWGFEEYKSLNKYTVNTTDWDYNEFYKGVNNLNTYFKGVHPVRFIKESQVTLNNYIMDNFDRFIEKRNFNFVQVKRPYFCNTFFLMKTETYKKIFFNNSLFVDTFDEVPISKYMNMTNSNMVFISQGYASHPSYNSIDSPGNANYKAISDDFFNFLKNKQ